MTSMCEYAALNAWNAVRICSVKRRPAQYWEEEEERRSIDELYEVIGLRHHGARRVRLSTSSLKQLGYCVRVNPTTYKPEAF